MAPFRIRKIHSKSVGGPRSREEALKMYLDRLMRMIPGEVVGLYLVGSGFIPATNRMILAVWSLVCLAGVIVERLFGTADRKENLGPQWPAVLISSVAFVIWLYSLGGPFAAFGIYLPYVGSLLVLAFTFFVPYIYRGE